MKNKKNVTGWLLLPAVLVVCLHQFPGLSLKVLIRTSDWNACRIPWRLAGLFFIKYQGFR